MPMAGCHKPRGKYIVTGNFSLRARARQYAEIAYHVKPEYRMPAEQRDAL